jgi:hypothetical protein
MENITQETINEWKSKFGKVFKVVVDGKSFYYTTLRRDVYTELLFKQQSDVNFDYEFEVIKACTLSPEINVDFKKEMQNKSGIGITLLEQIMSNSGWQTVESEEL